MSQDGIVLDKDSNLEIFLGTILPIYQKNIIPSANPLGVILGGQPGSGKSRLINEVKKNSNEKFTIIDGDYIRSFHPKYIDLLQQYEDIAPDLTQIDTNKWVEQLRDHCISRCGSFIIEGTMRDSSVPESSAALLRSAGYRVEAHIMAVPPSISLVSTFERYEAQKMQIGTGRRTTTHNHDRSIKGVWGSAYKLEHKNLVDRVALYRRSMSGIEKIYDNYLKNGHWVDTPCAQFRIVKEQSRELTNDEKVALVQSWNNVLGCALGRNASAQYLAEIDAFRKIAIETLKSSKAASDLYKKSYGILFD